MRFQMYANNRRTQRKEKSQVKGYLSKKQTTKKGSLEDNILNLRVNNLMVAYKDDPEVIEDLKGNMTNTYGGSP